MSHKNLIVTLISNDKPGIVSQVADIIKKHQGNWLDSHMVQLAGKFTGVLRIDVPEDNIDTLTHALKALKQSNIETLIEPESQSFMQYTQIMNFELSGPDRKGIVSEISRALNAANISIDKIQTHCSSTPWSGEPLFEAKGTLLAPESVSIDHLQDTFHFIEDELGINITFLPQATT